MILAVLAIAACCLLAAFAQPMQIGGEFGKNWLVNNGDRSVVRERAAACGPGGTVQKGQYLTNGVPESIGSTTI